MSAAVFSACDKDDPEANLVSYTIQVEYPENYSKTAAENVDVVLKNLTTNQELKAVSDAEGEAKFSSVTPGNYSVTASRNISESEAEALTGVKGEVFLNATLTQLQVLAEGTETLKLQGSAVGNWVIKEFYYSGAPNSFYFYDGFIEIYNNATETLYADGLLFGTTKSASSSSTGVYGYIAEGRNDAYLAFVMRIPGSGTQHPVEPGKSIVIAIDGIDHKGDPNGNANSPVNLGPGVADFEVYFDVNPNTPDTDNPAVPNVEILHAYQTTLFDYLPGVFGSGLVIFRHDSPASLEKSTEPNSTSSSQYVRVPKEAVIDGLDAAANATITAERKRLPVNIDAGMNTVGGTYTGTSLRRKVKQEIGGRKVLLDSNNSGTDFEVNATPSPKTW
ncbi:MAG: hypothetical protein ABS46_20090 [Cytophagaceae bacterium SCN 52-12]|nr:MAG: hypothetical protein ABS46_20090 [Cytophagaceae bacterium SCN 52-12]